MGMRGEGAEGVASGVNAPEQRASVSAATADQRSTAEDQGEDGAVAQVLRSARSAGGAARLSHASVNCV
jgi:hypothetical protein